MSLPFLPKDIVCKIVNVFTVLLFYSEDRKLFGNLSIFNQFIQDMNELKTKGLEFDLNGKKIKIFFECALILGDNLGLNSVFGLNESFNSHFWCRICRAPNELCKILTVENRTMLRNEKNYEEDLSKNCPQATGIKERCIFHRIQGFHFCLNQCIDIMHDLFEGVANYVLVGILNHYIYNLKLFTLDTLNARIEFCLLWM